MLLTVAAATCSSKQACPRYEYLHQLGVPLDFCISIISDSPGRPGWNGVSRYDKMEDTMCSGSDLSSTSLLGPCPVRDEISQLIVIKSLHLIFTTILILYSLPSCYLSKEKATGANEDTLIFELLFRSAPTNPQRPSS